jgi:regulator of protease activity HflC (stomatin/prohibitin superfamily)
MDNDNWFGAFAGTAAAWLVTAAICAGAWGCPRWNVYRARLAGQAELAQADSNRQIATLEARAKHESAKELAQAEVERAKGVAQANKIIGDSLHGNEDYLRYLWIHTLGEKQGDVIYVPTEANLPILEATRRMGKDSK